MTSVGSGEEGPGASEAGRAESWHSSRSRRGVASPRPSWLPPVALPIKGGRRRVRAFGEETGYPHGDAQGAFRTGTRAMLSICLALLIGPSIDPRAATPPEAKRHPETTVDPRRDARRRLLLAPREDRPRRHRPPGGRERLHRGRHQADRGEGRGPLSRDARAGQGGRPGRPLSGSAAGSTTPGPSRGSSTRSTPGSGRAWVRPSRSCSTSTSWPRGRSSSSLGAFEVSDDGNLLASTRPTSPASGSTPSGSRTCGPARPCPTGSRRPARPSGRPTTGPSSTSPRTPPSGPISSVGTSSARRGRTRSSTRSRTSSIA